MIETTRALIVSYLKYGDNSLIIKCYTEEFGFKSFIMKNSFSKKNKKSHYIFALNEVELTFYPKKNNSLELIKDIYQGYFFKQLPTEILKSSIITFIGEILNQALRNETERDVALYGFIKNNLIYLDDKQRYFADFHLYFLLKLSQYLGFHPLRKDNNLSYFNLREGVFSLHNSNISKEENGLLWNNLLEYDFAQDKNCFTTEQRTRMLDEILSFYGFHLTNFKPPLSLEILKLVFQ